MAVETEVKIRLESAAHGRRLLANCGLAPLGAREFESNQLYDTADQRLRSVGQLIRIRKVGTRQILTYKGKSSGDSLYKIREELETTVGDSDTLAEILNKLGYQRTLAYEKYRTEYQAGGELGHILLDETPIGVFLELEGDRNWIDDIARRLGFGSADYVTASYGTLFSTYCRERGLDLTSMTFGDRHP